METSLRTHIQQRVTVFFALLFLFCTGFIWCEVRADASAQKRPQDTGHRRGKNQQTPSPQRKKPTASPGKLEPLDSLIAADVDQLLAVASGAYDMRETVSRRVSAKIKIDGILDEAAWQAAERMSFVEVVTSGPPLCGRTEGAILWDERYLYIGLRAEDKNVWATMSQHDDILCHEEVLEVFIDPDGDQKHYIEIEINPRNAVFDLRYAPDASGKIKQDKGWNCPGLQHAVTVNGTLNKPGDVDQDWVLEMAIPWHAFKKLNEKTPLPPKNGDVWRINLYRYERPNGLKTAHDLVEYSAWSPTRQSSFHVPARFGKLIFSTEEADPEHKNEPKNKAEPPG